MDISISFDLEVGPGTGKRELFRSHGAGGQANQMALAPAALTKQYDLWSYICT